MKVKRIIEIEEYHIKELQEYCKGEHHGQLRFEIISSAFSSIAHSKPYNPSGDCNGDKLLSVFEGATIYGTYKEKGIIKVCVDNSYVVPFDLAWWNSEYKESEDK